MRVKRRVVRCTAGGWFPLVSARGSDCRVASAPRSDCAGIAFRTRRVRQLRSLTMAVLISGRFDISRRGVESAEPLVPGAPGLAVLIGGRRPAYVWIW